MSRELLGKVIKKVPFIEGAEVTFLGDVSGDFFERFNQKVTESGDADAGFWSVTQTVIDWNFCDDKNEKLLITADNVKRLPLKLQKWLFKESTNVLRTDDEVKKG